MPRVPPSARLRNGAALATCLLLAGLVPASLVPAWAADPPPQQKLQQVERDLKEAEQRRKELDAQAAKLASELGTLRQKSVSMARALQKQESAVTNLEDRLADLQTRETEMNKSLSARRAELSATLSGLVRLSRQPAEAVLLAPGSALDMVRSSQLIAATVPPIEHRATELRAQLVELAALRQTIQTEQAALVGEIEKLNDERAALAALQAEIAKTHQKTLGDSRDQKTKAQLLAEEARDLRALIQRLREEEERRQAEERRTAEARRRAAERDRLAALPPPSIPRGERLAITLPARGQVVGRFGEADQNGSARKGIDVETRSTAQVVAPASGKVVFAGQFKGYGLLLIIAHGDGYHSLLSGLERIDAAVGDKVSAGEPVGKMGSDDRPVLYVEVRRQGEPVNPIPWLVAGERKVSG